MSTMTMFLTESFSSFHFEGNYFIALYLTKDFGFDSSLHIFAYGQFIVTVRQQDFCEFYFIPGVPCQFGNIQGLVLLDPKLLAGYFYNCEHKISILGLQR